MTFRMIFFLTTLSMFIYIKQCHNDFGSVRFLKDVLCLQQLGWNDISYYIDTSVLLENISLVKFVRNYIRDTSGVFSISSLVRISMTSGSVLLVKKCIFSSICFGLYNKKKITRWLEDMNFIFEWQKQYFQQG